MKNKSLYPYKQNNITATIEVFIQRSNTRPHFSQSLSQTVYPMSFRIYMDDSIHCFINFPPLFTSTSP